MIYDECKQKRSPSVELLWEQVLNHDGYENWTDVIWCLGDQVHELLLSLGHPLLPVQ
jgi:hypothetical protein